MHLRIFFITGQKVGHERSNDGLVVRPPKFHVLPIFLNRFVIDVTEIKNTSVLVVPTSFPHKDNNMTSTKDEMRITLSVNCFVEDKPSCFHGMTGVQGTSVDMIDNASIRSDLLHDTTNIFFDEIVFDFVDPAVNPFITTGIANGFS